MKYFLLVTSLVLFCAVKAEGEKAKLSKKESVNVVKQLQGNWVSIWSNAESDKIDKKVYFTFKKNTIEVVHKEGIGPEKERFKIRPSNTPEMGGIDIISPPTNKETKSSTAKGLYILKENTLVLFMANAGEPRPKKISSSLKPDEDIWFLILVKEK